MDIREAAAAYESSTRFFLNLARGVTPELLDVHHENGWSARQIIHHVADSEAQSYARIRRLVAEPEGSVIQGYDEGAWAESEKLGYKDAPEHSESGKFTIEKWLVNYTKHPLDHGDQLIRATKGQE